MRVPHILPCVCIDHDPHSGDSVHYGMPHLEVWGGKKGDQFYSAYCPVCKRGGLSSHKSAYLALKEWNKIQEKLWYWKVKKVWEDDE